MTTGDDEIAGWLGTFCWNDTCRDGPTAPKSTLPKLTATDDTLAFAMEDGTLFYEWWASYSAQSNGRVTELGHDCCALDPNSSASQPPGLDRIEFPAPPPGDWVVHVSVYYEWGDASYAWHVKVPD